MTYLRRISTLRLILISVALGLLAAATAAIALAAGGAGPTPPAKPLDEAVHDALSASPPEGVTARVHFTDNLIGESLLEGADPLLSGASGRLWASSDGRLRLELQADVSNSSAGDLELLVDHRHFMLYDPGTETAYEGTLPKPEGPNASEEDATDEPPSLAQVREGIEQVAQQANLGGATPSDVAGRAAYTLRVSPQANGGLVGGAELAWDAANGVPLRAAVYAKGESSPVLELSATEIGFGAVADSVFEVTPPPGAKVVQVNLPEAGQGPGSREESTGLEAVQSQVEFQLSAPPALAGMARDAVRPVGTGEGAGALVTYGEGLGGLAVLELPAKEAAGGDGGGPGGLQLPTVSIEGATAAQELETPLGTLIRFRRGGVDYTVAGSVTPAVAREAAQGL